MNDVYTQENRNFVVPEYVCARLVDAVRSVEAAEAQLAAAKQHEAKMNVEAQKLVEARRLVVRTKAVADQIWDARQAVGPAHHLLQPAHHLLQPASASRKHSYNEVFESLSQSQRMAKHIYDESARALKALLKEDEEIMEKQKRAEVFGDSSSSSDSDSDSDSASESGVASRGLATRCENGECDDSDDDVDAVELARKRLRRS